MKKATNRQLKDWGALIPGYPVRHGIALIPDPAAETVKASAGAAGADDVSAFLNDLAEDAVNRPGSPFYIHG